MKTITIMGISFPREVESECRGGLALHEVEADHWHRPTENPVAWGVTHIASGKALLCALHKADAEADMERALALPIDWTCSEEDLDLYMQNNPITKEAFRTIRHAEYWRQQKRDMEELTDDKSN